MSHFQAIMDFGYAAWWSVLDAVKHLIKTPGSATPSGHLNKKQKKKRGGVEKEETNYGTFSLHH